MLSRGIVIVLFCFLAKSDSVCPPNSVKKGGVTAAQITEIVNVHNNYRLLAAQGKIPGQPKASNMRRMTWDSSLAAAAQDVSKTCVFAHVSIKDKRWSWVGQNLYLYWSTANSNQNWTRAVASWYNEYPDYEFGVFTKATGHYSQIVNAATNKVGCGFTQYYISPKYNNYYVCNYGPGGNIIGETPYKTGPGCENLC